MIVPRRPALHHDSGCVELAILSTFCHRRQTEGQSTESTRLEAEKSCTWSPVSAVGYQVYISFAFHKFQNRSLPRRAITGNSTWLTETREASGLVPLHHSSSQVSVAFAGEGTLRMLRLHRQRQFYVLGSHRLLSVCLKRSRRNMRSKLSRKNEFSCGTRSGGIGSPLLRLQRGILLLLRRLRLSGIRSGPIGGHRPRPVLSGILLLLPRPLQWHLHCGPHPQLLSGSLLLLLVHRWQRPSGCLPPSLSR